MATDGKGTAAGQVRQVLLPEAKLAAQGIAESFLADKVARYFLLISDCNQKLTPKEEKLNLQVYECLTAAHCLSGLVFSIGAQHDAVALWLPPGSVWNWKTWWKSGMWWLWVKLGREGRRRFFGSWESFDDAMVQVMGERASKTWILTDLGTRLACRGKGHARELMKHGLALADAKGEPVYLECIEENTLYYEKFGFKKMGTFSLSRAQEPILLYSMVREPESVAPDTSRS